MPRQDRNEYPDFKCHDTRTPITAKRKWDRKKEARGFLLFIGVIIISLLFKEFNSQ